MDHRNHMAFIYSGPIPDFYCTVCGAVLVSFNEKKINPGKTMHKDKTVKSEFGQPKPYIERRTAVVCPEHQAQLEDEGYYLASWWSKDGLIHGIK